MPIQRRNTYSQSIICTPIWVACTLIRSPPPLPHRRRRRRPPTGAVSFDRRTTVVPITKTVVRTCAKWMSFPMGLDVDTKTISNTVKIINVVGTIGGVDNTPIAMRHTNCSHWIASPLVKPSNTRVMEHSGIHGCSRPESTQTMNSY